MKVYRIFGISAVIFICLSVSVFLLNKQSYADSTNISIDILSATSFYSGQKYKHKVILRSDTDISGDLFLDLKQNGHTIRKGSKYINLNSGKKGSVAVFDLDIPDIKKGLILDIDFNYSFILRNDQKNIHIKSIKCWVFSKNFFTDKKEFLSAKKIVLYDPKGASFNLLKKKFFQIKKISSFSAFKRAASKVFIIGERADINTNMAKDLVKIASNGNLVICLNPDNLKVQSIPYGFNGLDNINSIHLYGSEVIKNYDKRLDSKLWFKSAIPSNSISIYFNSVKRNYFKIVKENLGWKWMELYFPETGGKLIVNTLTLSGEISKNPTPIFLLYKILLNFDQEKIL